jgi:hypothetical protein
MSSTGVWPVGRPALITLPYLVLSYFIASLTSILLLARSLDYCDHDLFLPAVNKGTLPRTIDAVRFSLIVTVVCVFVVPPIVVGASICLVARTLRVSPPSAR